MAKLILFLLLLTLSGCSQDLDFKINYGDVGSLAAGDPIVKDGKTIGKVVGLMPNGVGGNWVEVAIAQESASLATSESSFVLIPDPDRPGHQRIELLLKNAGGQPLAEGAVVQGSYPQNFSLNPLTDFLKGLTDGLRDFRGQVEQFRKEFEKLPNSPEAKNLQGEWTRLMDEITKAQSDTTNTVQKDILPKLQKEMDELRKRMEAMQKAATPQGKPL